MWAITNYYRDQQDDLEKYKMICRFVNPEAAKEVWDKETSTDSTAIAEEADFLSAIRQHTKENISDVELSDRIFNPEKYDVDTIERVS